jgi:hypothetical protein
LVVEKVGFVAPKGDAEAKPVGCPKTLLVVLKDPSELTVVGAPNTGALPKRLFPSGMPPKVRVGLWVVVVELENSDEPVGAAPKVLVPNAGADTAGVEPNTLLDSPICLVPQELTPEDDPNVGVGVLLIVEDSTDPGAGAPKPKGGLTDGVDDTVTSWLLEVPFSSNNFENPAWLSGTNFLGETEAGPFGKSLECVLNRTDATCKTPALVKISTMGRGEYSEST